MKNLREQKRLAGIGPRFEWTATEQDDTDATVDIDQEPEGDGEGDEELDEAKDPIDLAIELLTAGSKHMLFKHIDKARDEVDKALIQAKKDMEGLKRIGAGGTEEDTLVKKIVLPKLEKYAHAVQQVADSVKQAMQ
jgi:hypothetical protein